MPVLSTYQLCTYCYLWAGPHGQTEQSVGVVQTVMYTLSRYAFLGDAIFVKFGKFSGRLQDYWRHRMRLPDMILGCLGQLVNLNPGIEVR